MTQLTDLPARSQLHITTTKGARLVEGYDLGVFAITPFSGVLENLNDGTELEVWVVTHLPTGFRLTGTDVFFTSPQSALPVVAWLDAQAMPWGSSQPDVIRDASLLIPDFKCQLREVILSVPDVIILDEDDA